MALANIPHKEATADLEKITLYFPVGTDFESSLEVVLSIASLTTLFGSYKSSKLLATL